MSNAINHPAHYQSGEYECIKVMEAILTPEQFQGFCLGCAFKYTWRAGKKESFRSDVEKAAWYLDYLADFEKRLFEKNYPNGYVNGGKMIYGEDEDDV
jgi:hypothetical protein